MMEQLTLTAPLPAELLSHLGQHVLKHVLLVCRHEETIRELFTASLSQGKGVEKNRITSDLTSRHRDNFVQGTVGKSENYWSASSSNSIYIYRLCYLGELVGMVGSMETKAPSGSTIMMAVFLQ